MPVSGPGGTLEALTRHAHVRRILIHINNSNPILIEGSPEEAKVKAGAIQRCAGYGKDSAKEGSPTMATTKLSDEALNCTPRLRHWI